MQSLKDQHQLIAKLQLPKSEKKYSYNDQSAGKVLFYMLIMVKIIEQSIFLSRVAENEGKSQASKVYEKIKNRFTDKLEETNDSFIKGHQKFQNLLRIIVKVRQQQIFEKIKAQQFLWHSKGTDLIKHFFIIKQFYTKIFRIHNFIHYNEKKLMSSINAHEIIQDNCKYLGINIQAIQENQQEVITLGEKIQNIKRYLESTWIREKGKGDRKVLFQLRRLAEIVDRRELSNHTLLGMWSGFMLFMLATIIFLFINYDINFNSEPQFQITFPIWRGMCYFIIVIWFFGVQSYTFQTYGINFRMLTTLNNLYIPKYPQIFTCAAFFTTLHMFMFMLYMLVLAQFGITFPDNFQLHYLPAVSWICFILFFFVPLPIFHYKKRLYPLCMLLRALFSPILGTQFKFHWWTQIWISFRQPFRDILFTINYYFFDSTIIYENTIIYETLAGLFIYSLRIIQNTRQMRQNNLCGGMPFWGSIKCALNIITVSISYLFRIQALSNQMLIIWIISAIISTSYAYHFDLKYDWGLLKPSTPTFQNESASKKKTNKWLRKSLMYGSAKLYYSIIILNLLFRFIWVLNISPDILRQIPLQRYILILVVSSLELLRRCMWSILRIQNQHIIAQNYYESIGIIKQNQSSNKNSNLLVDMSSLNKTFCRQNQEAMNEIYQECQQQVNADILHNQSRQKSNEKLQEKTANKQQILELLIAQIKNVHQNIKNLGEETKSYVEEFNYKNYIDNSSMDLFSSERDQINMNLNLIS